MLALISQTEERGRRRKEKKEKKEKSVSRFHWLFLQASKGCFALVSCVRLLGRSEKLRWRKRRM
jgi:hypothetical protein